MSDFKQANRFLQFSSPLGTDVLLAESIDGVEGVSRLYSFHVELLAQQGEAIDPSAIVGNKVTLKMQMLENADFRYFNGLVASFEQNPEVGDFDSYTARIVPSLWQLTLATNCRTFQGKLVMDIIKEVISPYGLSVGDVTDYSGYKPLDYCTQYNETDFAFISRLAEQYGIFYWFEHSESDNKVVFGDSRNAYAECPSVSEIEFVGDGSGARRFSTVSDFRVTSTMVTGKHSSANWDYRPFEVGHLGAMASTAESGQNAIERYSWPAGDSGYVKEKDKNVSTPNHGARFLQAQADASDANMKVFHGVSTARSLASGYTFTLSEHVRDDFNTDYFLTEVAHHGTQSPSWANDGTVTEPYRNRFVAVVSTQVYRPEYRTPKPKTCGPQIAVVVTPDGEEQYIDSLGRINVRFMWDRTAGLHKTDNTWVRVSQSWASRGFGTYFWPRIDDEVIVDFIDGDPDDPVVVGSVYNGNAMPKYALPDMQTRSGIVTRSTKQGGAANANELRFEDKMGSEQIFINAEKDIDVYVENDARRHVLGQDSTIVDKDQLESVGGDYNRTVTGAVKEAFKSTQDLNVSGAVAHQYGAGYGLSVGGDALTKVSGKLGAKVDGKVSYEYGDAVCMKVGMDLGEKVGMSYALDAGMDAYIKGGMNVTIEAGMSLTLKGPGGFINIGPAGIAISGTMVLINSGGAAGVGTPPTIEPPDAPTAPQAPKDPDKADDGTKGGKM